MCAYRPVGTLYVSLTPRHECCACCLHHCGLNHAALLVAFLEVRVRELSRQGGNGARVRRQQTWRGERGETQAETAGNWSGVDARCVKTCGKTRRKETLCVLANMHFEHVYVLTCRSSVRVRPKLGYPHAQDGFNCAGWEAVCMCMCMSTVCISARDTCM